jgi:hypothetical protein
MTASDIERAERASRSRSLIMAVMAVILLIQGAFGFGDEASSMTPMLRHVMWGVTILFWLIILATGGWLRLGRDVRAVMNDEVSLANRSAALQAGFWTAIAVGLAIYFASLRWEMSLREGLRMLLDLSIAAALFRYAWLELRA